MSRKLVAGVLLAALVLSVFSFSACAGEKVKLSELEDQELIQYLIDSGVSIPDQTDVDSLREAIKELELDPDAVGAYGWDVLSDLHESVRKAVKKYYEAEP